MKRSEIVKTIKDFFYNNDFYNFDDEHADLLLSKLESQGMQPPKIEKWRELSGTILGEGLAIKTFEHEWEPEDEKK
jgi:hypothetical protein